MMKNLSRNAGIGLKLLLEVTRDYSYIVVNKKYQKQKRELFILLAISFAIFCIGVIAVLLSKNEAAKETANQWFIGAFIVCVFVIVVHTAYSIFIIWRKLYKERMEKEGKQ